METVPGCKPDRIASKPSYSIRFCARCSKSKVLQGTDVNADGFIDLYLLQCTGKK